MKIVEVQYSRTFQIHDVDLGILGKQSLLVYVSKTSGINTLDKPSITGIRMLKQTSLRTRPEYGDSLQLEPDDKCVESIRKALIAQYPDLS